MRDIAITLIILASVPFILRRPVIGIYMWVWVSVMNPHRLTWNFAYEMPFAQLIAICTLIGMLFNREPRRLPITPVTVTLLLFILWMNVGMLDPLNPISGPMMWERVMKIMFMVFLTAYILHSKEHIQVMIWIIALSVAFFGIKGGIFTLVGGGQHLVWGPPGSFIQENNALALATIMIIPLLRYLHLHTKNRWIRLGLLGGMGACLFSALGSHSRGGFLAIGAMLAFLWLKSRSKIVTGFVIIMIVPFAIAFMPAKWTERMSSIKNYEQDESAMGRINAWQTAINVAKDRVPLGGSFELGSGRVFAKYAPVPNDVRSAHSIWFQVLGEHGFVGLGLWLLFWFLVWRDGSWIIKHTRKREGWQWASDLARMIQVSLIGYAVGGTFLNLAYFDVPYYLMVAIVLTRVMLEKEIKGEQKAWYPARPHPGVAGTGGHGTVAPADLKPRLGTDRGVG